MEKCSGRRVLIASCVDQLGPDGRVGEKRKSSDFDLQDTGEPPRDPLSQPTAHVRLKFFQRNMNIYIPKSIIKSIVPACPQKPPQPKDLLILPALL